jgi:ATP-dependent Clp endopeptidase proteolytic subunit ClpP
MARRVANLVPQPQGSWYRVIRDEAGPTRVDIYDEIGGHWLFGGVSAADFVADLAQISGDLEVHINSPGGDVFDGLAIYNSLAQRPGNVKTVVDGLAASAASFIAQAGTQREISPGAMVMIHEASGVCMGNSADMRELADLLDKVSGNIASLYATHSGNPDGWRDAMQAETWYTAQEAVDAGLADGLSERPAAPDAAQAAARWAQELRGEAGRVLGMESMPLLDKAMPVHHTATVDTAWDGPAAVAAMPADDTVLEYCHAWQSPEAAATPHKEGDDDADDKKGNYKFPHHKDKGGPANLPACRNGLARLSSADIPAGDDAGVKAHLQAHIDDAGKGDDDASNHADMPAWLRDDA